MKLLEDVILREGHALNADVLLVDSFLNNQVDVDLMKEIGETFARAVKDLGITRVMTIESSGIAPAAMTALAMGLPMTILKKSTSRILTDEVLQTEVFSFTKAKSYQLTMKKKYIKPDDKVLLIDDFLAMGEAATGAGKLIQEAGAEVAAIGIVIEKSFQPGRQKLIDEGYKVISLARVAEMGENLIRFAQADA